MKTNKVTTFEGFGTITAPGKVSVKSSSGETQEIETKNIIIATGSVPVELPFAKFDGKTIVSSTEALSFTEPPPRLARHRRGRDRSRARFGLEPARFGSNDA